MCVFSGVVGVIKGIHDGSGGGGGVYKTLS